MKILVACERSGIVRDALIVRGHDAVSCDIEPSDADGPHIQGDIRHVLQSAWDLVIAHPPCTRLCNSGVRWLHERNLWDEMREGADLFLACLNANAPRVAVENPVMHKYAREIVGRRADFTIQPWQFGDNFKKRTCFWTRGLPPLTPTSTLDGSSAYAGCHMAAPGPDRSRIRSQTYPGIAAAIAKQWGNQ